MELLAVIVGLKAITNRSLPVIVYSDSKYVVDAINLGWLDKWKRTGFVKKANVDLWKDFLEIYDKHQHAFKWVKGHASNIENNRCDELAVAASRSGHLHVDTEYEKNA